MKTRFSLALACALLSFQAAARDAAPALQANFAATRSYYDSLVAGPVPNVAQLTLFTNLLPKGADLHHHYTGAIYVETYLDWAAANQQCIYTADVTDKNGKVTNKKFTVGFLPPNPNAADPAVCATIDAVRANNAFYRQLLQVWSDKDYDNHSHAQLPPDQQFFETFGYFGAASPFNYIDGLQGLKARAKAENVGYLETMLRGGPVTADPAYANILATLSAQAPDSEVEKALIRAYSFLLNDPKTQQNVKDYVDDVAKAAQGLDDEDFTLRFQSYVSRNSSPDKVFSSLYSSFAAAAASPLVVGVNIVGPENGIVAMRDYSLHMKMFAFLKKQFPQVKLALHAGELAIGMVPPEGLRSHIREAVLVAGADRIGHGVDIAHETDALELMATMKQRDVAVEVNLTSNAFILGVKNEAHPVLLYSRQGVPFVISTDDAGVSRNNLSTEYLLYTSRYRPSYQQLKNTVYNGIRYSFLTPAQKQAETARLDRRFAEFEARMAELARTPPAPSALGR